MTWTIMMTQKELCIKPYGFLVIKIWKSVEYSYNTSGKNGNSGANYGLFPHFWELWVIKKHI